MASEEQRKAFAAYMGVGAAANSGAAALQFPAMGAGVGQVGQVQGLGPQVGGLPTAPTPPLWQGSQAGFGLQGQFPQCPPPLGRGEALGQAGQAQAQGQSHSMLPPPPIQGMQHEHSAQPRRYSVDWRAGPSSMMSASRRVSGNMVEQHDYSPHQSLEDHPQVVSQSVPVLLCHTCSICGRMRSAGFHRHHPVIPGEPLVTTPCRRCKRRAGSRRRSMSRYTRVRTCIAEEPCDWPRRSSQVDVEYSERRGRRRSREEVYVTKQPVNRPKIIRERSSEVRLGLRALQREWSPPRGWRSEARVRVSSLSPRRASSYGNVWPPPDVVPIRPTANVDAAPPSDEVWPPPDVVRTHSYRKVERSPIRQSSRIIELSPSPPPTRTRSMRATYRSDSLERRPRSPSGNARQHRRSESEVRMASHPRPFRTVIPDRRTFLKESDETSSNTESTRTRLDSPNRGILKPAGMDHETSYRRRSYLRDSEQSTRVEVGSPHVRFVSGREEEPTQESRGRTMYTDDERPSGRLDDHIRYRYVERPPSPPMESMQRLNMRQASPPPRRVYDDAYASRGRRTSPGSYEEICIRHTSISPPPSRGRMLRRSPSPSPKRSAYSPYRHKSRIEAIELTRSVTPLRQPQRHDRAKARDYDEYELTDSGSEADGDGSIAEVRSWRGIDENGRPATFFEDTRSLRLLEGGSERGEFRELGARVTGRERVVSKTWRDV